MSHTRCVCLRFKVDKTSNKLLTKILGGFPKKKNKKIERKRTIKHFILSYLLNVYSTTNRASVSYLFVFI